MAQLVEEIGLLALRDVAEINRDTSVTLPRPLTNNLNRTLTRRLPLGLEAASNQCV